ncbi:DUF2207 domain-containing protein [Achromobacter sp. F4_2707]|uniref:DUF2207 domain-containing protein n=1 Tax=Achromobacter sp. F4_2707 TaxID=3114286 RepID=UPI0039C6E612
MGRLIAGLVCAAALLVAPLTLQAEERINDFHVDIEVLEDGQLDVTERIHVTAERDEIVHGIQREIPLAFITAEGRRARSRLWVYGVERDGNAEHHITTQTNRGVVIRIGSADVELAPGDYEYEIRYTINRVISFSDNHDRLIWNVNGNENEFPIDALSARVVLPDGVEPLAVNVYTGYFGDDGNEAEFEAYGNEVTFSATRPYEAGENMTIELLLPKGVIQPPDEATLSEWESEDYASAIAGATTFTWSALLAFTLWLMFGRDPRPGVVVPQWNPPAGLSPASVNYNASKNFEAGFWTAFSASIIDLAVKGKVVLEDLEEGISVRKLSDQEDAALPTEQAVIMQMLPPVGESLRFNIQNGVKTLELGEAFSNAVEKEIGHTFYKPRKAIWMCFGILMLLVLIVHESDHSAGVEYMDGWIPAHWVTAVVAWYFALKAVKTWRQQPSAARYKRRKARVSILRNLLISAAILLLFTEFIYDDAPVTRDNLLLAFAVLMITTLLWAFIGRLSREGRKVMDDIDGLRLYLELAEKERMALADAPTLSPAHYETLLPYAVALGVEKAWTTHFETALANTAEAQASYQPVWYGTSGRSYDVSGFSSSMANRIQDSLPREQDSSGSGSSGSSGSGRGGGGVSGW